MMHIDRRHQRPAQCVLIILKKMTFKVTLLWSSVRSNMSIPGYWVLESTFIWVIPANLLPLAHKIHFIFTQYMAILWHSTYTLHRGYVHVDTLSSIVYNNIDLFFIRLIEFRTLSIYFSELYSVTLIEHVWAIHEIHLVFSLFSPLEYRGPCPFLESYISPIYFFLPVGLPFQT